MAKLYPGILFLIFLAWDFRLEAFKLAVQTIDGVPDVLNFKPKPFERAGDGYYYLETKRKTNWYEAYEECRQMNASLVSFDSKTKWKEVVKHVGHLSKVPKDYWTSGTSNAHQGKYVWFATGHQIDIDTWMETVYTEKDKSCVEVHIGKDKGLRAKSCFEPKAFICESRRPKTSVVIFW